MASRPLKQFGQHWLRSDRALNRIVAAAELKPGDRLLEIGPGTGLLTRQLLPRVEALVAVEIDRNLCQQLTQKLGKFENFSLIEGDILALNLEQDLQRLPDQPRCNKVVANIPYYITGPILEKLLGTIAAPNPAPFESLVLLLQKEVADRLCAKPSSRAFGALSVRVQYLAQCEFISIVAASAFHPPPKVDSAIVRLKPHTIVPAANHPKHLETLVKLGFGAKRKMLRNNLKSVIDSESLTTLLESLSINPQARAEDLSVADWVALSNQLSQVA